MTRKKNQTALAPLDPVPQNRKQAKRQRNRQRRNRGAPIEHFAPVAVGMVIKKSKPVMRNVGPNAKCILHREQVGKITTPGTGAFTVLKSLALNPGVVATFPWLSNESAGWEFYEFLRMRLLFVPNAPTSQPGNLMVAPDYDAADAAPSSEAIMSSYTDSVEGNLWQPLACDLDPEFMRGLSKHKLVRQGALAANLDIKTYDSGTLFVACTDDAASVGGKLWIEYEVVLRNPQVPPGGFQNAGTLQGAGGSFAAATPFGAVPLPLGPVAMAAAATNVVTLTGLSIGSEYFISVQLVGTVITACSIAATTGATAVTTRNNAFNAAGTNAHCGMSFTATASTATLTLSVTATTVTASQVVCTILAPIPAF